MGQAYKKFWGNYANFEGVSSRSEFWLAMIANYLVLLIGGLLILIVSASTGFNDTLSTGSLVIIGLVSLIIGIYFLAMIIPAIAITVRRLRDGGFHWAFIFIQFIPYIGSMALFVLELMPTKKQDL